MRRLRIFYHWPDELQPFRNPISRLPGLIVVMLMEELTSIARRFYALARTTSDPSTKERLTILADSYLEQADQLKRQPTVTQTRAF